MEVDCKERLIHMHGMGWSLLYLRGKSKISIEVKRVPSIHLTKPLMPKQSPIIGVQIESCPWAGIMIQRYFHCPVHVRHSIIMPVH